MSHLCMFKIVDGNQIQCVIKPEHKELFESDGFVDHVDKLVENKPKPQARKVKKNDDKG